MHWTTNLLNKYKEALVAFDTDYVTGYAYLRENQLTGGICWYLDKVERDFKAIIYVMHYVAGITGRSAYLTDLPSTLNAMYPGISYHITKSIKTRMQHLHRMREELNITEPLNF